MDSFKYWMEVVELRKPKSVKRTNPIKDKGTNVAHKVIQYRWTTQHGNKVMLQFEPKGDNHYSIIFYVNDVLFDYGSKLGIADKDVTRDSDILSNVFFVLKQKANQLKAKSLTFTAHKSDKDTKIIRNLSVAPVKQRAMQLLDKFVKDVYAYPVKMIPPGPAMIALSQRIGKEPPPPRPDINKDSWTKWVEDMKREIEQNMPIDEFINTLKSSQHLPIDSHQLIPALEQLNQAIWSNTERGYERTINRRGNIYRRLVEKYFSDWQIEISGDRFTLTRM
jgi:hypothetical protein